MLGYQEQTNPITLVSGQNRVIANLNAENIMLEGAVVRDIANPVSIKEDTIAFHAAAVKLNAGEMAIDILEQMPGVEVGENGVTVLNEDVSTVYIDGALLFGDAPMAALNNLRAEEVVSYTVKALDRVYFAGLTKKGLNKGEWRYLTEGEVNILKMGAYV